ncbi:hypothetical protein CBC_A0983 [Clostridium botulinum C str. Eklund]|uniref:Uncharacterized protein n=1 Tax=Clostridium novyi A str. 4570 TaxID=1444290 RepID=A0AA88ZQS7_CLONO|nr:hypothetical protein [Clostridium novyi]EDS76414.1 hypothetical protein CBC_A0983 [Clostridium botulinum C str. Eklund]KGN00754.1 hypothetical protein Z969_09545 [Clostridium novyi A str. 4570]NEZ50205.1 hypothetical protein [Clostridium botulinum]
MKDTRLLKYKDLKVEVLESHSVGAKATVSLNEVIFKEGLISKIDFEKHIFEDGSGGLFINLYMGNLLIATVVTNDDYVIEKEDCKYPSYWIRKAEEYDY